MIVKQKKNADIVKELFLAINMCFFFDIILEILKLSINYNIKCLLTIVDLETLFQ